ncbi:unnamed protein product (macronuclear) [Paramecium tetraurelia]|uniref:Uncharacterized protein n=1 Tax=Paramecium tetraurelia TaxID=5888 RepID=A0EHD4_PARTE|nr:uncharacterized protein GSPATT00027049001 [Paramecium tetraurelia]CAK94725.1 unnamed protein product [Paramecium tetraurelia]|eukprot:XP_001462098.1 hypothetical protein (macronuclear) [Paramecium tetraurelia strain d4-2]
MDSSDSQEDSYQKDSLLEILRIEQFKNDNERGKLSIDFSNQVLNLGMFKKQKQTYIQNTNHTKELYISVIKNHRSISLLCKINILSQEQRNLYSPKKKTMGPEDYQLEQQVQRVCNTVRRKSCICLLCGHQGDFEKRMNTFQVKTQQQINSEMRLLKYNTRNQFKQQTLIRLHKIKQLQNQKCHNSSLSAQLDNQIQFNQTPTIAPAIVEVQLKFKKKTASQPVVLKQFLPTTKNYYVKQFHLTSRTKTNNTPTQNTLPSLKTLSQSRRNLFDNKYY